jgi:hypothetical protein
MNFADPLVYLRARGCQAPSRAACGSTVACVGYVDEHTLAPAESD